jgi:hypothetical protein
MGKPDKTAVQHKDRGFPGGILVLAAKAPSEGAPIQLQQRNGQKSEGRNVV